MAGQLLGTLLATKARSKPGPKLIARLTKDGEAEQTSSLLEELFRGRATTRDIATKARSMPGLKQKARLTKDEEAKQTSS